MLRWLSEASFSLKLLENAEASTERALSRCSEDIERRPPGSPVHSCQDTEWSIDSGARLQDGSFSHWKLEWGWPFDKKPGPGSTKSSQSVSTLREGPSEGGSPRRGPWPGVLPPPYPLAVPEPADESAYPRLQGSGGLFSFLCAPDRKGED